MRHPNLLPENGKIIIQVPPHAQRKINVESRIGNMLTVSQSIAESTVSKFPILYHTMLSFI